MKTQKEMVLQHLENFGSITTWESYEDYGITRLPSRICELRQEGHEITGKMETKRNRYGRPVSFMRYELVRA